MKYGVPRENGRLNYSKVREFSDEQWERLQSMKNPSWFPFEKKKVFISFCEENRRLMKRVKYAINRSELITPLVVEDQRKKVRDLPELVIENIVNSDYFLPILTKESIHNQWVNQEIGFAKSFQDIEIVVLVNSEIINNLKGFVHKFIPLPFQFEILNDDKRNRKSFRNAYKDLIRYLEDSIRKKYSITKQSV